jgi:transcription initiation factor TFIIIB Brf1 subunit/transcription initiation factor TFIIB
MCSAFDEEYSDMFGSFETTKINNKKCDIECDHNDTYDDTNGMKICKKCHCELDTLDFTAEWRSYETRSTDPSRCHNSKVPIKGGIEKVFQDTRLNLPDAIKRSAEIKYREIVGDDTVRGRKRKGIVAACLFHVYKEQGEPKIPQDIATMLGIARQHMSDGMTLYNSVFKDDRTEYVDTCDIIPRIMKMTKIPLIHKPKIIKLAKILENSDQILNRSGLKSVSSAIIYFYLCVNPTLKKELGMDKFTFSKATKLSDITIIKLTKKISNVLNYDISKLKL